MWKYRRVDLRNQPLHSTTVFLKHFCSVVDLAAHLDVPDLQIDCKRSCPIPNLKYLRKRACSRAGSLVLKSMEYVATKQSQDVTSQHPTCSTHQVSLPLCRFRLSS